MSSADVDPQHSWADDVSDDMSVVSLDGSVPPSYAQMARPGRRPRVLSQSMEDDYIMKNEARLSDSEKDRIHPLNILPERPCTAHFVLPTKDAPLSQVFADFKNCGIRAAGVRCLQRSPNGFVSVTFSTSEYRDCFLRQSSFISRRARRNSSSFTFVVIYDAPYELLDEALSHRLSHYGSVHGIRRCGLQGYDGIQSGTRVARMELSESIPSFMRFGRKLLRIKHEGQIPTCRKCHLPDHVARACPNVVCFNCDQLGHTFSDCTEDIKCSICKEDGHYAIDCRMSWWRRPALADIDVPASPVSHPSHPSTDVPPAGSPPPSDVHERPPPVPSPQPLSDDSSSQPPPDVPTSSVPLFAPPLQSSLSPSPSSSPSPGVSAPQDSPFPLHSTQSTQDSSQQSADPSQLSQSQSLFESPEPPSDLPPVPSPPSSVITGTPTVSDLQLAAEVPSQSPPTVSDEALVAMEISEVSSVDSPPSSQNSVRAFVSRVASKRKPARLDPADGPPPRKSTTPLPVSSGRKTNNPHTS